MKTKEIIMIGTICIGLFLIVIPDPVTTAAGIVIVLAGLGISE